MKYFYLLLVMVISGCGNHTENVYNKPIARVFDKYLYISDLAGVIPAGMPADDSSTMARDFIEKWIRNQLMTNKAEMNLTEQEKDVERQIESYRSSLLIYAYEQSYLRQNLDTVVTDKDIEEYFNENKANFIQSNTLMKGLFIKIPSSAPELYRVRQWYRSEDAESVKNLEAYCFKYATVFDHFSDNWKSLSEVLGMMPASYGSQESSVISRRYYEARDSLFYYYLSIKETVPSGTVAPLEIVKSDINNIILNKRKIKLINELETSIYTDAQNREHFNIYQ